MYGIYSASTKLIHFKSKIFIIVANFRKLKKCNKDTNIRKDESLI